MKIAVVVFCAFVVFCLSARMPWQLALIGTAFYAVGESLWQMMAWAHGLQVKTRATDMVFRLILLVTLWLGQVVSWLGWVK